MSAKGSVQFDSIMHPLTLRTSLAQWSMICRAIWLQTIKDPMFDFEGFSRGKQHSVGKKFPF